MGAKVAQVYHAQNPRTPKVSPRVAVLKAETHPEGVFELLGFKLIID
jgi:hypothetical protein